MGKWGNKSKWIAIVMACFMLLTVFAPGLDSRAASGWRHDSNGWYYMVGSNYYAGQWAKIDGGWYYFDSSGYMESSCYRDGYWLGGNGAWVDGYSGGTWKTNGIGWWFEDNGWFPAGQWLKINGDYYYFNSSGYMEYSCYRDGCWLTGSGAWDSNYYGGTWKTNGVGWWYEDNGWFPANMGLWIDGDYYWFNADGYWDVDESNRRKSDGSSGSNTGMGDTSGNGSGNGSGSGSGGSGNGSGGSGGNSGGTAPTKMNSDGRSYDGVTTDATQYSYEVIPMMAPFNTFFYVKTDNPDPDSFRFYDHSTKYPNDEYGSEPYISYYAKSFADVKYENATTYRVNGGYICYGYAGLTDGGELTLQQEVLEEDGWGYYYSKYEDTDIKVQTADLVDTVDYLIQTYSDSSKGYFENLSAIQSGLDSICLYDGVSILGEVVKMTSRKTVNGESVTGECYYGILSAGHADQVFYMGSPYTRLNYKPMLTSYLYPYILDSLGFPSMMATVAVRMDPNATYERDSYTHYLVHITHNGETRSYGGAGNGGGQGINTSDIVHYYKFDGSADDAYNRISLQTIGDDICYYGTLDIDSDIDKNGLKWSSIRKTVGTGGSYVRINASNWMSYSGTKAEKSVSECFTYIYDDGSTNEDLTFGGIGCFSNCWFDGRYYNDYEQIYKGVTFDESVEKVQPSLAFKDYKYVANIPAKYKYNYSEDITSSMYDSATGTWKGFSRFYYDSTSETWKSTLIDQIYYYDKDKRSTVYLKDDPTLGAAVVDACTITKDEAKAMNIDRNTNTDPTEYYIYDMTVEPGTYHK